MQEVSVITLTELRNDIYNKVGNVIATGRPIEVSYKGRIVRIILADAPGKLSRVTKRDVIVGDSEDL